MDLGMTSFEAFYQLPVIFSPAPSDHLREHKFLSPAKVMTWLSLHTFRWTEQLDNERIIQES